MKDSHVREKLFVKWLDDIKNDAEELYLLGDVFDFWFEYKKAVPRGFSRVLGKLAEFFDSGIPVHYFTGNHDIWVFDYLPAETGVIIHKEPLNVKIHDRYFYLAHGDGLGPYDKKFKLLKGVFTNSIAQWFYARLHPNIGILIAEKWSRRSRYSHGDPIYKGQHKEWLVLYALDYIKNKNIDYLVFGHRHIPVDMQLNNKSRLIILGDWINNFTYGVFDGKDFSLRSFKDPKRGFKMNF